MTALRGARVVGEHLHPAIHERFSVRRASGSHTWLTSERVGSRNQAVSIVGIAEVACAHARR
jgi:hypothetical protein